MKKTTKTENFKIIIEVLKANNREDLVEVMQHEIDLIEKKRANGKMTKTQEANESIKALILQALEGKEPMSITELLNSNEELNKAVNGSNQKLSALMTQLKNTKEVVRTTNGKKAVFSLNSEVEGE